MKVEGVIFSVCVHPDYLTNGEFVAKLHLLWVHEHGNEFSGLILQSTGLLQGQCPRIGMFHTVNERHYDGPRFATEVLDCRALDSDFVLEFQDDEGQPHPHIIIMI